jgi:AraC-like DNA-binding protein
MVLQAESFVCRRCRTNHQISHEAFDSGLHFHPEVEIILIEKSHGIRHVANSIERYGPGDLVLIGPNVPHVFVRDTRTTGADTSAGTSLVVHFRPDFMGAEFLTRPEMLELRQLLADSVHGLHYDQRTVRWVAPQLRKLFTLHGVRRVAVLLELLAFLAHAQGRPLASGAFQKRIEMKGHDRLDRVLAYLAENFHREISLASAAKVAALGPTSFSRWFKHATSKSFVECVTELRLGQAYRLLTETGKNVTEIAFDCGFNSVSHFIHRFQQLRGMSPNEFRRRARLALEREGTSKRAKG